MLRVTATSSARKTMVVFRSLASLYVTRDPGRMMGDADSDTGRRLG